MGSVLTTRYVDISDADWTGVRILAERIVDASRVNDEAASRVAHRNFFRHLTRLDRTYGPHPTLLSTRADFTRRLGARLRLLRRAYRLARAWNRGDEIFFISHSIGQTYARQGRRALAVRWLWRMKQSLKRQRHPDGRWWVELLAKDIEDFQLISR